MLEGVARQLGRSGLAGRARLLECTPDDLGTADAEFDFALIFFMVHEIPGKAAFFQRVYRALRPGGNALLAEPVLHVPRRQFERELAEARDAGFLVSEAHPVRGAGVAVLSRPPA
jgi:ubiquinone/menaquinone biosynthesis C-methylase UbiE